MQKKWSKKIHCTRTSWNHPRKGCFPNNFDTFYTVSPYHANFVSKLGIVIHPGLSLTSITRNREQQETIQSPISIVGYFFPRRWHTQGQCAKQARLKYLIIEEAVKIELIPMVKYKKFGLFNSHPPLNCRKKLNAISFDFYRLNISTSRSY